MLFRRKRTHQKASQDQQQHRLAKLEKKRDELLLLLPVKYSFSTSVYLTPEERVTEQELKEVEAQIDAIKASFYAFPRAYETTRVDDPHQLLMDFYKEYGGPGAEEPRSGDDNISRKVEESVEDFPIKFSLGRSSLPEDFLAWKSIHERRYRSFKDMLLGLIEEQGISHIKFYKRAGMDSKLFSKIVNQPGYQPSKNTAIQCCLGLQLDPKEADMLLNSAGYSLGYSDFDDVIRFCIDHHIFNTMDVDDLLYEVTGKTIASKL